MFYLQILVFDCRQHLDYAEAVTEMVLSAMVIMTDCFVRFLSSIVAYHLLTQCTLERGFISQRFFQI